ncbi:helix-turn-helix domain-containing protein [Intestinibacter sp.]
MEKRNAIGGNLRYFRKRHGLSQEQFVAKLHLLGLDLDRTSLSKIENYTRVVYDYEIIYFAKVLNISILDLYNLTNIKNDENK